MTALVSLLLPTRGRPGLARRFLESAAAQSDQPELIEAVLRVDDEDPQSHGLGAEGIAVRTIVGPRASMGEYNTACLRGARGDIVALVNDDVVIRTQGWDTRLRELDGSFPDRIYLAYPNDLYKRRSVCTFPILSRRTCELLVDAFPAEYRGAFIDYHLLDIFRRLEHASSRRVIYLEDVVFEHMHFRTGKGAWDATYGERDRFGDDDCFIRLRDRRSAQAAVLLAAISGSGPQRVRDVPQQSVGVLRATLFDPELPGSWRTRLFLWLLVRLIARRLFARGAPA